MAWGGEPEARRLVLKLLALEVRRVARLTAVRRGTSPDELHKRLATLLEVPRNPDSVQADQFCPWAPLLRVLSDQGIDALRRRVRLVAVSETVKMVRRARFRRFVQAVLARFRGIRGG